jgi:hypothetical protein
VTLEEALRMPRVAIAGGPRTGKTTLSQRVTGRTVLHTDDLIGKFEWSQLSEEIVRQCASLGGFAVEGVRVAHALRKGLEVDAVVWLETAKERLTPGQASMTRAVRTVFFEWEAANGARVPIVWE